MIAMHYGCVPIVRATGGLKDTVIEKGDGQTTGFIFDEATHEALADAIRRALILFINRPQWKELQYNGMRQDFSWERSAREYMLLYLKLIKERHL
jgi:starch synthase